MSLTEKTYARFWSTMGERYGKRWLENYGDKPTHAWRECLAPFTPKDIARAIDALSTRENTKQHPPTEPEFKALLQHASRAHTRPIEDPSQFRRGYWRSTIINQVAGELGYDTEAFEPVLIENKHSLGRAMKDLLDDVDELEVATGQRTAGMESMVLNRSREIVTAFKQLKAAA